MITATTRPRLAWVDAGKGMSILLVVFYHSTVLMASAGFQFPVLLQLNSALADLRMPTFFLLSGLFAVKWIHAGWVALFQQKLLLFVWVYVLWTVLQVPGKLISMAVFTHEIGPGTAIQTIGSLVLSPIRTSGVIWFIWALAVFFVLARATARVPLGVQFAVASVAAIAVRWLPDHTENTLEDLVGRGIIGALSYYVFFLFGAHFSATIQRVASSIRVLPALGVIAGAAAVWFAVIGLHLASIGPVRFLVSFAGLAAGLSIATLLQHVPGMTWLGARTLPVYLPNFMILIGLVVVVESVLHTSGPVLIPVIVALAAAAVLLCFALYRLRRYPVIAALYAPPTWLTRRVEDLLRVRKHSLSVASGLETSLP